MDENQIRKAVSESLSRVAFPDARQQAVLEQIRGGKAMEKKRISVALVCAVVLTLALAGAALAAALGVFGQLATDEMTAQRMEKLEESADLLNQHVELEASTEARPAEAETVYQTILNHQYGRSFALTLNQTYYDGSKLYYTYTLKADPTQTWQGEGLPTGFDAWDVEDMGRRYEDVWANEYQELDQTIRHWLNGHENGWFAYETWGLGDGADTADGTYLQIINSNEQWLDDCTMQGYQEVELPEELIGSEQLDIVLTVMYGASMYHQDETGVRWAHVAPSENRGILHVPFTVHMNGSTAAISGSAAFEAYTASASLNVSDVDISGKVTLHCPTAWTDELIDRIEGESGDDVIIDYHLSVDGKEYANQEGVLHTIEDGVVEIGVRFDLAEEGASLSLIPVYVKAGSCPEEAIPIR